MAGSLRRAEARLSDEVLATSARTLSAVFIFGGDITRAERPEHLGALGWRSLRKFEPPMPSYERVLAGAVLHRMNPALILIPSAGQSNLEGAGATPPIASVMAAELRELGVPSTSIIEEQKSFVTKDHFITCSAIACERGWKATEIGIFSLFWHFGRITAMMTMMRADVWRISEISGRTCRHKTRKARRIRSLHLLRASRLVRAGCVIVGSTSNRLDRFGVATSSS